MSKKEQSASEKKQPAEKPVSLHPLGFEEALSDLLKTSPRDGKVKEHQSE